MVIDSKTFLEDAESLRALIERLPAPERAEYKSYGALALESAFPSRKLVAYTLSRGKAANVITLVLGEFRVTPEEGPVVEVEWNGGAEIISTTPTRIGKRDLFLHIPQNFVLTYKGRQNQKTGVGFIAHYAVLIKTRSKEIHQVDGHTYCCTLNRYRERFPG